MIGIFGLAALATGACAQSVGEWVRLADMPRPLTKVAAATDGDEILVVGETKSGVFQTTYLYDLATKAWDASPQDNKHNLFGGYHGAILVEDKGYNKAYLIGGRSGGEDSEGNETCSSAQVYNHDLDQWETLKNAPRCTAQPALAYRDDKIYMCGGYDEKQEESHSSCHTLDLATDTWDDSEDGIPMLDTTFKFWGAAACYHKESEMFFIIGGHEKSTKEGEDEPTSRDLATVHTYDFKESTASWDHGNKFKELPVARGELGAAICTTNYIYVIGGAIAAEDTVSKRVDILDIAANEWIAGPDLPEAAETYPVLIGDEGAIIVAGGEGENDTPLKSVYMLMLKNTDTTANSIMAHAEENEVTGSTSDGGDGGRSGGEKFGIAVGVILLIVAVAAAGFFGFRYYKAKKNLTFSKYEDKNSGGQGISNA